MKKTEIYKIWKDLEIYKRDIDKIILSVVCIDKNQLFFTNEIDEKYIEDIINCFKRLKNNEPLEYIIQKAEFYSLDFFVDSRVLIPRNDTEVMVDEVLKVLNPNYQWGKQKSLSLLGWDLGDVNLIDVWTWSSCIPITIIKNTNKVKKYFVTDISKDALEVSKINIKIHDLENEIEQIHWNLLESFISPLLWKERRLGCEVIITANLPYIKNKDYKNMDIWTIKYNPDLALYWWEDTWFELYEKLIHQCLELKCIYNIKNFILFIEIWFDQEKYSREYLENLKLEFEFFKDNSWINRCIKIIF